MLLYLRGKDLRGRSCSTSSSIRRNVLEELLRDRALVLPARRASVLPRDAHSGGLAGLIILLVWSPFVFGFLAILVSAYLWG